MCCILFNMLFLSPTFWKTYSFAILFLRLVCNGLLWIYVRMRQIQKLTGTTTDIRCTARLAVQIIFRLSSAHCVQPKCRSVLLSNECVSWFWNKLIVETEQRLLRPLGFNFKVASKCRITVAGITECALYLEDCY